MQMFLNLRTNLFVTCPQLGHGGHIQFCCDVALDNYKFEVSSRLNVMLYSCCARKFSFLWIAIEQLSILPIELRRWWKRGIINKNTNSYEHDH
jgi:hypothetical protein